MEQESFKNGTGCMTMLTTMTWGIQINMPNMPVQFSEVLVSTLTLVGEELGDHQRRQVGHFNLIFSHLFRIFVVTSNGS